MDELRRSLRPLLENPPAGPPPVEEIAERARRRRNLRRTRRGVIAGAVGVLVIALLWHPSLRSGSESETTTADEPETVTEAPSSTTSPTPSPTTPQTTTPETTATLSPDTTGPGGGAPSASTTTERSPGNGPLDPFGVVEAEAYSAHSGARVVTGPNGDQWLEDLSQGDHVAFHGIDFGTGLATQVEARVAPSSGATAGGTVEVRLDRVDSPPIATLHVPINEAEGAFVTISAPTVAAIGGRHDIYLTFTSPTDGEPVSVDWFRFVP